MSFNELPAISYGELVEQLTDPTSDFDHYSEYLIEILMPEGTAPELQPNPSLVTDIPPRVEGGVAMGFANWLMRTRRHKAYRRRLAAGWDGHRIVSEGDSWFQHPTKLQDIIDHLMKDHAILSLGAAGDELKDIQRQREIIVNLRAERASALLLSGGGNDLFDKGQMGRLVETPFPDATAEDLVGAKFNAFLREILGRFLSIFTRVHSALPHVHILVHGYGPAFPQGGAWIEKPLTNAGVPPEIQHDVVKLVLRKFNDGLARLAERTEFHGKVAHLDVTDIGTKLGDWHDEIHLNGPNAAKVAARFRKELKRRLSGPAPESQISTVPMSSNVESVVHQAETLAAFDENTLLQELDMRVALVEMDPTVANEAMLQPMVIGRSQPEIGLASLRSATRKLIKSWEENLRDLICGGKTENAIEQAILDAISNGKVKLSGAIAGWLVTGPLAVPAALASALAAWLASKVLSFGVEQLCLVWKPDAPTSPSVLMGATESNVLTLGEMRSRFATPAGEASFTADDQKTRIEQLDEVIAKDAVEKPNVPVDADAGTKFRKNAATIYAMLGGEADDVPLDESDFGTAEAIVIMDGSRPALYVRDGFIDLNDPKLKDSGWLDRLTTHEATLRTFIGASGRVIRGPDRSANSVYGSAWMLSNGRVATARHVVEEMAIHNGTDWFLKDIFYVDFCVEADREVSRNAVFRVANIDWTGPTEIAGSVDPSQVDAAVLTLVPDDNRPFPDPLPLTTSANAQEVLDSEWFVNVGHPAAPWGSWLVDTDDGNDKTISKALVHALIGDKFGVKRLSPGKIDIKPGFFPGDQETKHVFTHDATTLGGSSGSGALSLTNNASVCGLHFAGLFGTRNYAHFVPPISKNWNS